MALANYADLQASALDWMTRAGQTGKVADWITLAEARLNRELSPIETDVTLVGTVDSRDIDISTLSMVEPVALWVSPYDGGSELILQPQSAGTMPYVGYSGLPAQWALGGSNITFDRKVSQAYQFRFRYVERFNLSVTSTNWLLTNNPDLYLAATLMWGGGYNEDWANGQVWKSVLDEAIPSVRSLISRNKRGTLRVDPALSSIGSGRWSYNDLVNNG